MKITFVEVRNVAVLSRKHAIETWFYSGTVRRLMNMGFYPNDFRLEEYVSQFLFRTGGWIQAISPHLHNFEQEVLWYTGEEDIGMLLDDDPRLILLSITEAIGYPVAQKFVRECRLHFANHRIWVGGLYATTCPDLVADELKPDLLFVGEADADILALVTAFSAGDPVPDRVIVQSCPATDLYQDWTLSLKYSTPLNRRVPLVLTSRDCTFDCAFCSIIKRGAMRSYSIESLEHSLSQLTNQAGDIKIIIESPLPLASRKWVDELTGVLGHLGVAWYCDSRVLVPTSQTQRMFDQLKAAGCSDIYFGTETFDQSVHDRMAKGVRVENIVPLAKQAQAAGINVQTGWIVGFPGQTSESARRDVDMIIENLASGVFTMADYTYLTVFPGSRMLRNPGEFGIELVDWDLVNITCRPCHNTQELQAKEIWDLYLEGMQKIGEAQGF